jgi:two-component system, response regulator
MRNPKTILLAEDNTRDVELTLEAISDLNMASHVTVVRDGIETLDYLRCEGKYKLRTKGNPAVVLLDIKMPKMDGIEVLRIIRSDPKLQALPVVMLTSSRERPDLVRCYQHGVNAYVVKPVDFREFLETIKHIGVFWASINEYPHYEE